MKVLSLTEPYATLISLQKKRIETRSWKTSYRGELYIHASVSNIPKEWKENKELMSLVDGNSLNFGYIICKCNLVDCIYMTKEYVDNMKKNNYQEYLCGVYEEGRYAWILDNIEELEKSIKAKGQLNIWDFYNEQEIMELMNNVEYGWIDKNKQKHYVVDKYFSDNYVLQSPKEVLESEVGICFDQVELERYYFKNLDYDIKTYFLVYYDNDKCPAHTFLVYQKDDKYYWFEHAWKKFRGIHEFNSLSELFSDVKEKFIKDSLQDGYDKNSLVLHEYSKPKFKISTIEFYNHCDYGKFIALD